MLDLVGNPEDRFSHVVALIKSNQNTGNYCGINACSIFHYENLPMQKKKHFLSFKN